MKEERLYAIVLNYLKENGCMTEGYSEDGATKFDFIRVGRGVQADVVGVKDVGRKYSHKIEIAAVEVKATEKAYVRDLEQALGYSTFAHRCYLAMPISFSEEIKNYARHMGVGLLEIRRKKIREVLSPESKTPDETMMIWFLRRSLSLVKCVICGCIIYRFKGDQAKFYRQNAFGKTKTLFVCPACRSLFKLSSEKLRK